MVIAGAMMYIAKSEGGFTKETSDELTALLEWILGEHQELWHIRNYEKGIESFVKVLNDRLNETKEFIKI